jgi:peptidoglycan hydrolase-like protein with peptidoglycan-binding domain
MLLSVKKRQTYLKALGYYKGDIDGKAGNLTKAAYKAL